MNRIWKKKGDKQKKTSLHKLKPCYFWNLQCVSQSRLKSLTSTGEEGTPFRPQLYWKREVEALRALEPEVFYIHGCSFASRPIAVLVCEGKLATPDGVPQVQLTAGFIAAVQSAGTGQGFQKYL
jgi:hypothetical protein